MKLIKPFKIFGFIFASIMGTLLHFVFEWSNKSMFLAPFCAVNESVWEHMKLLFVPLLIYTVIEAYYCSTTPGFWASKLMGTLFGVLIIPILYYTYTGALGINADWFNIAIFFIGALVTFYIEYMIIKQNRAFNVNETIIKLLFIFIALLFVFFTFYPLRLPLFMDPTTRRYGI